MFRMELYYFDIYKWTIIMFIKILVMKNTSNAQNTIKMSFVTNQNALQPERVLDLNAENGSSSSTFQMNQSVLGDMSTLFEQNGAVENINTSTVARIDPILLKNLMSEEFSSNSSEKKESENGEMHMIDETRMSRSRAWKIPASCSTGRYGQHCRLTCDDDCPGNLCSIDGTCFYEKCDGFKTYNEKCVCRAYNHQFLVCSFRNRKVTGLRVNEEQNLIILFEHSMKNDEKFRIDWWVKNDGNLEGNSTRNASLPLFYNTFYIICVMVDDFTAWPDPNCINYRTAYRCIGRIGNVQLNYDKSQITWSRINNKALSRHRISLTSAKNNCGKEKQFSISAGKEYTRYNVPKSLRGDWSFCIQGVKSYDDDHCLKNIVCKTFNFGPLPLGVDDFTATGGKGTIKITWLSNILWSSQCTVNYFRLKWGIGTRLDLSTSVNCINVFCEKVIADLKPVMYTVEITPIFENDVSGTPSSSSVSPLSVCLEEVSNIQLEESNQKMEVSWSHPEEGLINYYVVQSTSLNSEVCGLSNIANTANPVTTEQTFPLISPYSQVEVCVQPISDTSTDSCNNNKCVRFDSSDNLPFEVQDFMGTSKETVLQLTWRIPSIWMIECDINFFSVQRWSNGRWKRGKVVKFDQSCQNLRCSHDENYLLPFTKYRYRVAASFRGSRFSNFSVVELKTLEKHPIAPITSIIVDPSDESLFLSYDVQELSSSMHNFSCDISATESKSERVFSFNCTNENGFIENDILKSGKIYNVSYTICNTRSCVASETISIWTPPVVPEISVQLTAAESNATHIILNIPSIGEFDSGHIYVLVAEGADAKKFNKTDALEFVRNILKEEENKTKSESRKRRENIKGATSNILLADILPLNTQRYALSADDYKKTANEEDIYVSSVYALEAGNYRKFGATNFAGPFDFKEEQKSNSAAVFISVFLAGGLVAVLIFTLYLRRRKKLLAKTSTKDQDEANEDSITTQNNMTLPTSDNLNGSSTLIYPISIDEECTPYVPLQNEQSSVSLSTGPTGIVPLNRSMNEENVNFLAQNGSCGYEYDEKQGLRMMEIYSSQNLPSGRFAVDESVPECDVYMNIVPKRTYEEEIEFKLLEIALTKSTETEYKNIPTFITGKSTREGTKSENRLKNRYQNNIPYDETRVILPMLPDDPTSDYINANKIEINVGSQGEHATYITTQGPMKKSDTISDFWKMVWSENIQAIVMLTNLVENGKRKCDQYWPEKGNPQLCNKGEIQITLSKTRDKNAFIVRSFSVQKNEEIRNVVQYHYTQWPDHGVPIVASPLARMTTLLRSKYRYGPTIIHCSAGLGRTGSLLLTLMCLEDIDLRRPINSKAALIKLRQSRPSLIQSFMQYQFSHFLLWVLRFETQITLSVDQYISQWQNGLHDNSGENEEQNSYILSTQYQKLKRIPKNLTFMVATNENIRYNLNRFEDIFPADSKRVPLINIPGSIEDQYINAIRVDGFNKKDAYIVTEHPTLATLGRVWLMILERQIPVWVLLNQIDKNDQNYPSVIPEDNSPVNFNLVTVELVSKTSQVYFEESNVRVYAVLQNDQTVSFECRVIRLNGWHHPNAFPESGPESLFAGLDYIHSGGPYVCPILFSCCDGCTASGATLALDIARKRAQTLQEVNLLSSCITIAYSRPEFIISLEQYKLLHEYIASYLLRQEQDIYGDVDGF